MNHKLKARIKNFNEEICKPIFNNGSKIRDLFFLPILIIGTFWSCHTWTIQRQDHEQTSINGTIEAKELTKNGNIGRHFFEILISLENKGTKDVNIHLSTSRLLILNYSGDKHVKIHDT